eukprot:8076429-Alexandrium_andersonii.AAC.1
MHSEHKKPPAITDSRRRRCVLVGSRMSRWTRSNTQSSRLRGNANHDVYVLPLGDETGGNTMRRVQGP